VKRRRRRPVDPHVGDRVVAAMVASVPGLSQAQAVAALAKANVVPGVPLRQVDDYLAIRPHALRDLGDLPPWPLVRLMWALAEDGYPVPRPRCARCAVVKPNLRHPRADGRICDSCAKLDRSRPCARCGRLRPIERTVEGGICGNCWNYHPDRQEPCTGCGQPRRPARRLADGSALCNSCYQRPARTCTDCGDQAPVQAITDAGPVCRICYRVHQPRRLCGRCGRNRPVAVRATETSPDICLACHRGPEGDCVVCGRHRHGHTYNGAFRCDNCIPRPLRECSRCYRRRTVQAVWPTGPVCSTCYRAVRDNPQPCATCGEVRVLTAVDGSGAGACGPCVGARDYSCGGCGRPGFLYADERCQWCVLDTRVRDLLTGPDGRIAAELVPLHVALTDTDRPASLIGWLGKPTGSARLLAELAGRGEPISHDLLDQLAPAPGLHYLREVLILAGTLPPRNENLERIGPWLRQLLADVPARHTDILQPFAHWNVLHRARRRAHRDGPRVPYAGKYSRDQILAATRFLTWLDDHDLHLGQVDQRHLDDWLTTAPGAGFLRSFIQWTNQRQLTHRLSVPVAVKAEPGRYLADDQRWSQLRDCLNNTAIPLKIRVAGALILLLGIGTSRVCQLSTADIVATEAAEVTLNLGKQPVQLPPRLAVLVTQLVSDSPTPSALRPRSGPRLLFPGRPPTRPQHPTSLGRSLARWGISPHAGRNAALLDLATDLPASVVADLLGLHPGTAVKWSKITKRDWASYLASRDPLPDNDNRPAPSRKNSQ